MNSMNSNKVKKFDPQGQFNDDQKLIANLYMYYENQLMNLEIDIKNMNKSIQSPKLLQTRKFRKPKKTTFLEILKKGKYEERPLRGNLKIKIDAITNHTNIDDLTQRYSKRGIIIAFVFFEAFIKDIIKILDNSVDTNFFNILSDNPRNLRRFNEAFNNNLDEQFSQWKFLKYGYYVRNIIVHNNGKIDENFINKCNNLYNPDQEFNNELIDKIIDYEHTFIDIKIIMENFLEFILEKLGLRVCCHCKIPYKDIAGNMDDVPFCMECRN